MSITSLVYWYLKVVLALFVVILASAYFVGLAFDAFVVRLLDG